MSLAIGWDNLESPTVLFLAQIDGLGLPGAVGSTSGSGAAAGTSR